MKKIILLLLTAIMILPAMAQDRKDKKKSRKDQKHQRTNAIAKQEEEGVIKYRKHSALGLKLNTDGYGGFLEVGRARSVKKALLFQFEITERKHPKEEKRQGMFSSSTPYIYGKINFFYPVKLGVQQQFLLGNKGNKNGVSVTANVGGGIILGLLRPYLVDLYKNGIPATAGYESPDSIYYIHPDLYINGPSFGKGWKGLTVTPGAYIKPALRFDYGKYNEMISAIEVGMYGEFYSKKIPQMIYNKQKQFFFSAYVSLIFGRRK